MLDRTGLETSTTTHIEDITHKRSSEDLKQELNHLLHTLSIVRVPSDEGNGGGGSSGNVH